MRVRNFICVLMLAGLTAFAQQTSNPSQSQSTAQSKDEAAAAQQKKKASAAEENPFPEAESQKAQDAANGTASAKPSQSGYSSSHVDLKRFAPDANRDTRISNGEGGYIHDPQLAAKDDKVGKFYLQTGDYKGAYDRYKEASLVAPEDANAVFGLAESARGLGWNKIAITNYTIYLDAIPNGEHAKDARKALKELKSKEKK